MPARVLLPSAALLCETPAPPVSVRPDTTGRKAQAPPREAAAPDTARKKEAAADTTRRPARPRWDWRRARIGFPIGAAGDLVERASADIDRSTEGPLRTLLEWETPLRLMPSGTYDLPDPIDAGDLPGREPPEILIEGLPVAGPGYPEMPIDPLTPSWISRLVLRQPDPLSLPNNPSGGPLLDLSLAHPDSTLAASGARLTSGTHSTYTDEFFMTRPTGSNLLRIFYDDNKTSGRDIYQRQYGQDLLARIDRGTSWGGWRIGWQDHATSALEVNSRRLIWDRSVLEGGLAGSAGGWSADLSLGVSWDRLGWLTPDVDAIRKDAVTRGLLALYGPGRRLRPRLTVETDFHHQRFLEPQVLSLDRRDVGLGIAAGADGESKNWRWRWSVGRSTPAPYQSGWVAALDLEQGGPTGWTGRLHADRTVRAPLMPRLTNELGTMVGQALTVPVVDISRRLEEIARLEAGLGRGAEGPIALTLRGVEIRHTVSAEGGLLSYFSPNGYLFLPPEALDRTVRVASARLESRLRLPFGFRLAGMAIVRTSHPSWQEQLWMTPWEGRVRVSWQHSFFDRDLNLELFVRGAMNGRRATPQGILNPTDRYDGGATARIDKLTLFFLFLNLEDDLREAAGYDGGWVTQPLLSSRMGLTWRFSD